MQASFSAAADRRLTKLAQPRPATPLALLLRPTLLRLTLLQLLPLMLLSLTLWHLRLMLLQLLQPAALWLLRLTLLQHLQQLLATPRSNSLLSLDWAGRMRTRAQAARSAFCLRAMARFRLGSVAYEHA